MFRNAEWVKNNIDYVVNDLRKIDRDNIYHIDHCPGCSHCLGFLMEFYSGCEKCGETGHKGALNYIEEHGYYICDKCL